MPDSKITALASTGTGTDPANDPLVIVDVSDTSMAASGTTKKVTLNNLLACSPTATLASATITGDLTVDTSTLKVDSTNNRVGIGTATPAVTLDAVSAAGGIIRIRGGSGTNQGGAFYVSNSAGSGTLAAFGDYANVGGGTPDAAATVFTASAVPLRFDVGATEKMRIASDGICTWSNVGGVGGTAMTLNATGLGVGEAASVSRLQPRGSTSDSSAYILYGKASSGNVICFMRNDGRFLVGNGTTDNFIVTETGNVGVGVTPSAWAATFKPVQIGSGTVSSAFVGQTNSPVARIMTNSYFDGTNFVKVQNNTAGMYVLQNNAHEWHNATTGTGNFTFTQAMTLTASGELLVGTTTANARLDVRTSASQRIINAISTAAGDASTYGVYIAKFSNDSTTAQRFIGFTINNDGAGSGQINANGASQAAFGSFSDYRLKENIVSLPSQLANILSLRPVEFDYKDGSGHQIGFVAQEIQEVYADTVAEQDGFLTVTGWSKTEARLVSAIKELAAKVQALEAKLA